MKNLILFTGSYPFSSASENSFIPQELSILSMRFKEIIIVPIIAEGETEQVSWPNIIINLDYYSFLKSKSNKIKCLPKTLISKVLLIEIIKQPFIFLKRPKLLRRVITSHLNSRMTLLWIYSFFRKLNISPEQYIFGTWWFDEATLGLAWYSSNFPECITFTRSHGIDLFEERHPLSYIPFRHYALKKVDYVFPDSLAGLKYLSGKYPDYKDKLQLGLLGVFDPGCNAKPSNDGVFRLLTCSFLIPLKRIDLLIRSLKLLINISPGKLFYWTHIGNGPEKAKLEELARNELSSNIGYQFKSYTNKKDLHSFYCNNYIDLFINVSSTEGTPVAIIEALSYGVPVLATSVGGNMQIVNSENGILVDENPSPLEIANAIRDLAEGRDRYLPLRAGSKNRWNIEYNASVNYNSFADMILNNKPEFPAT